MTAAQWAELQQIADQGRERAQSVPVNTSPEDLLAPGLSHLRPVAQALLQEMGGNR